VEAERGAEVEARVAVDAVEPVAVVRVRVGRRPMRDGLGRLVDRIIVEAREHRSSGGGPAYDRNRAWAPSASEARSEPEASEVIGSGAQARVRPHSPGLVDEEPLGVASNLCCPS